MSAILLLATAVAARPTHATNGMAVYYTSGYNWMDIKTSTPGGDYNIAHAVFDADGTLVSTTNLTDISALDMGYVAVDSKRDRVIFSSQRQWNSQMTYNNVELMTVPLNSSKSKTVMPLISSNQTAQLLAICAGSGGPHGCNQMSQFSPIAGTSSVLFALRFWGPPPMGYAIGNQAIAVVRDDGTASVLTWSGGYADQFTQDLCPSFVPGTNERMVLFARSIDTGVDAPTTLCLLDLKTKQITKLSDVPLLASKTGCPHFLQGDNGPGATFIYLSTTDDSVRTSPTGTPRVPLRQDTAPQLREMYRQHLSASSNTFLTAVTVETMQSPAVASWSHWWNVPLVAAGGWIDVPSIFQCSQLQAPSVLNLLRSSGRSDSASAIALDGAPSAVNYNPTASPAQRLAALKATTTLICETALTQIALVASNEEAKGSFKKLATYKLPFGSEDAASGGWCITADCFRAVTAET